MITRKEMKRLLNANLEIPATVNARVDSTLSLLGASQIKRVYKQPRKIAMILIAAALILALLTGTAFAIYYRLTLKDLVVGTWTPADVGAEKDAAETHAGGEPATDDKAEKGVAETQAGGESATDDKTESYTLLSIAGLASTPEYKAAMKWEDYLTERLEKGENLLPPGYVADESDVYFYCGAFSQEAKDMLDAITSEYGLKMNSACSEAASLDELYAGLGVSGFMPAVGNTGEYPAGGRYYDSGSFQWSGAVSLPDGNDVRYHFFHTVKGTFTRTGFLLAEINDFEEWTYATSSGFDVLLAISANKSLMVADLENSFVFVNILSGTENADSRKTSYRQQTVDRRGLEAFAESFDFAALNDLAATTQ